MSVYRDARRQHEGDRGIPNHIVFLRQGGGGPTSALETRQSLNCHCVSEHRSPVHTHLQR